MADQQFLASFGVDIDEGGVARLQKILSENRTLAQSLSSSFSAAAESVKAFKASISEDLPSLFSGTGHGNVTENLFGPLGGLKLALNMTEPKKEIASFTADAKKPIALSANASAVVSSARTALEEVRRLFSQPFVLNVRADTSTNPAPENPTGQNPATLNVTPNGNPVIPSVAEGSLSNPPSPNSPAGNTVTRNSMTGNSVIPSVAEGSLFNPLRMSSGGRFSRPTSVEVAEDGDAEYIIPVKKEDRALPLLRRLLSELSPSARASLAAAPAADGSVPSVSLSGPGAASLLSPGAAVASAPSGPLRPASNVSAPVTINVNASGASAEAIGRTIYNTAERTLLRTLQSL